jgi:hypothetical protein
MNIPASAAFLGPVLAFIAAVRFPDAVRELINGNSSWSSCIAVLFANAGLLGLLVNGSASSEYIITFSMLRPLLHGAVLIVPQVAPPQRFITLEPYL